MDEHKRYAAVSIPARDVKPAAERPAPVQQTGPVVADFAEIEFESSATGHASGGTERQPGPTALKAQPVGHRMIDPIRQKFYQLRSLATDNPFARNDAGLFYRQARFMADFTDEYPGHAQFSMYYPYYQHMGYEQLRTYFTWRAKARRGEITPTSLSYVFLYIYELLSHIGVSNPSDGLDKLMTVWNTVREHEPALDQYLPRWLKDYHIFYELPHSFADFVSEHGLQRVYPELFLTDAGAENSLALWNGLSSYDITKSKFYGDGNDVLLGNCFAAVLRSLVELFERRRARLEDLFIYDIRKGVSWHPFQRALFYPWLWQPDRWVEMPGREVYYCENNQWTADIPIPYSDRKELVGYFIKKTETCLRQAVKYKFKISVYSDRAYYRLRDLGIPLSEVEHAIEKAVEDFHRDLTRTVVTVDHGNLARIREEALGTQDKLTVPEENTLTLPPFAKGGGPAGPEDFPRLTAESPVSVEDGWDTLRDALTATERESLSIALRGGADIRAFADENGVMLEILADSINEKAMDHIGDNILEMDENMTVYGEYKQKVSEMVG